jgi:glycosyltransferase involved in cell wall biosynthesis
MTRTPEAAPAVSVIVPAYNAAWCVGRALDSVLEQDFRDYEVIVVDDGSTDDTAAVLAKYGDAIRVVRRSNGGLSSARNAGTREARGEFITFLDADDWWLPQKLSRQIESLRARPDIGFCSTAARIENPEGALLDVWGCPVWGGPFLLHLFQNLAATAGSGSAVMVRRTLLIQVGEFDEGLRSLEDIDMWFRLAAVAGYACIPEPLVVILKRPGSMSCNLEVMREAALQVMRKNRNLLPVQYRGGFWRTCMASIHGDYAKWRYRAGQRRGALLEVAHLLGLAPLKRGRLGLGLLKDMILRRPI